MSPITYGVVSATPVAGMPRISAATASDSGKWVEMQPHPPKTSGWRVTR
jgi:hypothetical protein